MFKYTIDLRLSPKAASLEMVCIPEALVHTVHICIVKFKILKSRDSS